MGRRKARTGESERIGEGTLSIWISRPSRTRIEEACAGDSEIRRSLRVVDGERWWECDADGHVTSGQGERGPALTDAERHFHPKLIREFFQALTLEALGPVRTAGRDCVRLRGVLRPGGRLWPHWLAKSADEYEFHADRERGALLAIISRFAGQAFEKKEVTDIAFDEELDSALFTYIPQLGDQIRPPVPVAEHLTLDAAAKRMPFTILVPTRVPDPDHTQLDVTYHPARLKSPLAKLHLSYRNFGSRRWLWIYQSAAADPELDAYEWDRVERGEQEMRISDPGVGMRLVALERHGTHVVIRSDLERDTLLDLAASLTPAAGSETLP